MKDYLIRGGTKDGSVRFFSCTTTNLAEEARIIHDCNPLPAAALGRMLTASSMMGIMLKSDQGKVTIQINGKGPIGGVLAASNHTGRVKGYVGNPYVENKSKPNGKLDVGWAVGFDGTLTVIKDLGMKEPYVGQVPIASGEIADDLTVYFANSEQIPTSVGLGVLVETDGSISASGGFIIQVMPEADDAVITSIEENLVKMKHVTELIHDGKQPEDIIKEILGTLEFTIYETIEISYECDCSRDRIERALISIGESELNDIIEEQGEAEITCHFCNKKYQFEKDDLIEMLEKARS